jgi:hypothetical protein
MKTSDQVSKGLVLSRVRGWSAARTARVSRFFEPLGRPEGFPEVPFFHGRPRGFAVFFKATYPFSLSAERILKEKLLIE